MLAALAVVVVTARAQFGSYSHDLPFMGVAGTAATGNYIEYHWVASDLSGTVGTWNDRIQSRPLSPHSGNTLTATTSAIVFSGTTANNAMTNGGTSSISGYAETNSALGIILKFKPDYGDLFGQALFRNTSTTSSSFRRNEGSIAGGVQVFRNDDASITWFFAKTNIMIAWVLMSTNNGVNTYASSYTNGVLYVSRNSASGHSIRDFGNTSLARPFQGELYEIVIYTNIINYPGGLSAVASSLYQRMTNLYGP